MLFIWGANEHSQKYPRQQAWNTGDQPGKISSNDTPILTYRGRFITKDKKSGYNEAMIYRL
jgi:hypothetical protein